MSRNIVILIAFLLVGCGDIGENMDAQVLFQAIEDGDSMLVQAILHKQPDLVHARDEYEMTPLMAAVSSSERSVEAIEAILKAGAGVNDKTSEGYSPLHMMVDVNGPSGSGNMPYEIANLLVRYGADTESRQHWGWTPLMRAALEGTNDEFIAILAVGASTQVTYPSNSLPEFTRGEDILEIVLSEPTKVSALIKAGFPVAKKHIKSAEARMEQSTGKFDKEWSNKYIADIQRSIELMNDAIKP
jgi:ankyrin repeat protein